MIFLRIMSPVLGALGLKNKRWQRTFLVGGMAALACMPALAHGGFDEDKSLLTGVVHVLVSPLSIAALVALVASCNGIKDPFSVVLGIIAGLAGGLATSAASSFPYWFSYAGVVVLGLCAVAGFKPGRWAAAALALGAGLTAGHASGIESPALPSVVGAGLLLGFLAAAGLSGLQALAESTAPSISSALLLGRRVLGAWAMAIALLTGALAIKMHSAQAVLPVT